MLSRVAERCYWLARYLERAENSARLVRVYSGLLLDLPASTQLGWTQILTITGCEAEFAATGAAAEDQAMLGYLLSDANNPVSLLSSLSMARENARTTRDVLPSEAWRAVNELYLHGRKNLAKAERPRQRDRVLSELIEQVQGITGLLACTMSHGTAYQFIRLGRNLERADMTTRIIDVAVAILLSERPELRRFDNTLWMAILRSLSAYQMYRQYVRRRVQSRDAIRFLLHNTEFPRSVMHCLNEAENALSRLPRSERPLKLMQNLGQRLTALQPDTMDNAALHQLMDKLQLEIAGASSEFNRTWFHPDDIEQ